MRHQPNHVIEKKGPRSPARTRIPAARLAAVLSYWLICGDACHVRMQIPAGHRSVGDPCATPANCQDGFCIYEQTGSGGAAWKDGYCSADCSEADCAEGTCVAFGDGESYCARACAASDDCRTGYACAGSLGACLPDCRAGWSCGDALQCNQDTGTCDSRTEEPKAIGDACRYNADCTSNLCTPEVLSDQETGWPEGYCTQACDETSCPSGSTCISFADGTSFCASSCVQGSDCREGYVCSMAAACLPDCRKGWSCGTELTCDGATGYCSEPSPSQSEGGLSSDTGGAGGRLSTGRGEGAGTGRP